MTTDTKKLLINYLLFQIGWLGCVLGTGHIALYITSTILFIHFLAIGSWYKEKEVIAVCLLLGCTMDSFLGNLNILQFGGAEGESRILPLYQACIWVLLGTTLRHSLAWIGHHKALGALLGFVLGPTYYFAETHLTDLSLAAPLWQTLLILAVLWAVVLPTLQAFSQVWLKRLTNA